MPLRQFIDLEARDNKTRSEFESKLHPCVPFSFQGRSSEPKPGRIATALSETSIIAPLETVEARVAEAVTQPKDIHLREEITITWGDSNPVLPSPFPQGVPVTRQLLKRPSAKAKFPPNGELDFDHEPAATVPSGATQAYYGPL
ncbi:MAG: hypothetical protein WCJ37_03380 [Syntrophus sp. (in: bacteria)]